MAVRLRRETVAGALVLAAAAAALIWANTPWRDAYRALVDHRIGPPVLHLDMTLAHWSSDGALAVFFFLAGLELKDELTQGTLRDPAKAVVPVVAACCGVAVPALLYAAIQVAADGRPEGWAIPTATDIAFALGVLAVAGSHLPNFVRSFLLTLAVVDDLIAITIIALFYSDTIRPGWLLVAFAALAGFGLAARFAPRAALLVPCALVTWLAVLNSGVHATVAGVALGLLVPMTADRSGNESLGARIEHRLRPISTGVCVPVFAFCAAGVSVVGGDLGDAVRDPAAIGVVAGLVLGKCAGVFGGTYLTVRTTRADLDEGVTWAHMLGLSLLAGIGFTVSLLIGELAFGPGSPNDEHVKIAVLGGSLLSATLAAIWLRCHDSVRPRPDGAPTD